MPPLSCLHLFVGTQVPKISRDLALTDKMVLLEEPGSIVLSLSEVEKVTRKHLSRYHLPQLLLQNELFALSEKIRRNSQAMLLPNAFRKCV